MSKINTSKKKKSLTAEEALALYFALPSDNEDSENEGDIEQDFQVADSVSIADNSDVVNNPDILSRSVESDSEDNFRNADPMHIDDDDTVDDPDFLPVNGTNGEPNSDSADEETPEDSTQNENPEIEYLWSESQQPKVIPNFDSTDTWKDVLLEMIDANVLPAFLGGNRTDPDGDPMCRTFIRHGAIVPEDLYLQKSQKVLSRAEGVKKITISRFSQAEISFLVENQGSSLEWEFETKNRDIGFQFYYKDRLADDICQLIPKQRIDTYFEPETNAWKCERPGIYTIVFDNSYSWLFSKEIYYRVKITDSEEIENQAENWHNFDRIE